MNTQTKTQDLVVTRLINAPVEQAWRAWVEPDLVKRWWGPDGFTAPLARIDFRTGGTSLVCMSNPQFGDHYSTWRYTELVPVQHIEYIHNLANQAGEKIDPTTVGMPADFPQDMLTSVDFKPLGKDQTEITVTEHGWTEGQMMDLARMGLEQCLEKMAAIFK